MTNSEKALEFIQNGQVVGLGTGRAATEFLRALGRAVAGGLQIRGIPTSRKSAELARELSIPLVTLEDVGAQIDVTVDGADEFDSRLNLIKGLGGALVREKIVAAASRKLVILVGPDRLEEKQSPRLGTRGVLPVEIVPFALPLCTRRLGELGFPSRLRMTNTDPFVTDNGNYILDCQIAPIPDLRGTEQALLAIPGVVGTGLFLGMADVLLIQDGDRLEILQRTQP